MARIDAALPPDAMLPDASLATQVLTHSQSETVQAGRAFFCGDDAEPPHHVGNGYIRVFDLHDFDITGDFVISSVRFGVEVTSAVEGEQPAKLFFYTLDRSLPMIYENFSIVSEVDIVVPNLDLAVFEAPVDVTVPAGSLLIVELAIPTGEFADRFFYVGFNAFGQSDAGYLVAPTCGDIEPVDFADIGGRDAHLILSVLGGDRGTESAP